MTTIRNHEKYGIVDVHLKEENVTLNGYASAAQYPWDDFQL